MKMTFRVHISTFLINKYSSSIKKYYPLIQEHSAVLSDPKVPTPQKGDAHCHFENIQEGNLFAKRHGLSISRKEK